MRTYKPSVKKRETVEIVSPHTSVVLEGEIALIMGNDGVRHPISISNLVLSSEMLKAYDKRYRAVCVEHGSFIADKGHRQIPTCASCVERESSAIGEESADDISPTEGA